MMDEKLIISRAESIAKFAHVLIDNMSPPTTKPDRPRVALFLTICEQFEAALLLIRSGMASHASVHVRSMLEALVAMNLLGKHNNYVDQMMYSQLKGEKKIYEGLIQEGELPQELQPFVQGRLNNCKPRFDALHAEGFRPKNIGNEILDAGLADLLGPYSMLCGFSHNDLAVLALRHQGDESMTYMAPTPSKVIITILSIALRIIVAVTEPLSKIALFPAGLFDAVFGEMNKAWSDVLAQAESGAAEAEFSI
ncbi:DUF5677 domain-containing protein [Uliginosibacterium sp. 31-16]|uniref:DUF5677 domain-containing protein n=1 Tax=Uliginosibacterium sp. 31-16 TaxID=3068315 RepID=UPI00273F558B|nr:DUF5677 domain-containing protein [Uliginosibacterium sp. 31-16]MDP5238749.1 DUF5677 domain-containing protein [Uliginosibacterium sp. 31-16]